MKNTDMSCRVLDKGPWTVAMFEKLIWISAFMIVGTKHGGCTVGEVENKHKSEVNEIISELANAVTMVYSYAEDVISVSINLAL